MHVITLIIITGMPTIMTMITITITTMMVANASIKTMMIILIALQAVQVWADYCPLSRKPK